MTRTNGGDIILLKKIKRIISFFFCNSFSARRWRFEKKNIFFWLKFPPRHGREMETSRLFSAHSFFFLSLFFSFWGSETISVATQKHLVTAFVIIRFFFFYCHGGHFGTANKDLKKKESKRERGRGWTKKKRNQIRIFFSPSKKIK